MSKLKYLVIELNGQLEPCVEVEGQIYVLNEQKTKLKYEDGELKGLKLKLKKINESLNKVSLNEIEFEESKNEEKVVEETIYLKFFPEKGMAALHDEELQPREAELKIKYSQTEEGFNLYNYEIEWKDNVLNDLLENYSDYISLELNNKIYQLENVDLNKFGVRVIRNKYDEDIVGEITNEARFVRIENNKMIDIETQEEINVLFGSLSVTNHLKDQADLFNTIGNFLIARYQYQNQ